MLLSRSRIIEFVLCYRVYKLFFRALCNDRSTERTFAASKSTRPYWTRNVKKLRLPFWTLKTIHTLNRCVYGEFNRDDREATDIPGGRVSKTCHRCILQRVFETFGRAARKFLVEEPCTRGVVRQFAYVVRARWRGAFGNGYVHVGQTACAGFASRRPTIPSQDAMFPGRWRCIGLRAFSLSSGRATTGHNPNTRRVRRRKRSICDGSSRPDGFRYRWFCVRGW